MPPPVPSGKFGLSQKYAMMSVTEYYRKKWHLNISHIDQDRMLFLNAMHVEMVMCVIDSFVFYYLCAAKLNAGSNAR